MDYKKLIKALKCDGYGISQDMDGCSNRRCKYRDADGACNLVRMCSDASTAITALLERAEAAEARAEKAERERDDAVNLLKRVNDKTGNCYGCKYFDIEREVCTEKAKKSVCDCGKNNLWEWRGIKEE